MLPFIDIAKFACPFSFTFVTFWPVLIKLSIELTLTSTAGVNPQTGQPDYSAQWVEYYRSMGMTREAEAIEQQMRVRQLSNLTMFN